MNLAVLVRKKFGNTKENEKCEICGVRWECRRVFKKGGEFMVNGLHYLEREKFQMTEEYLV